LVCRRRTRGASCARFARGVSCQVSGVGTTARNPRRETRPSRWCCRAGSQSPSTRHPDYDPQQTQLPQCARDAAEIEELALPKSAMVVMYRHLAYTEPSLLDARHHFDSDAAAVALERKALQYVASKEAEVTVDVAQV